MKIGFAKTGIVLLLAVALTSSVPDLTEEDQNYISCLIRDNATVRNDYYRSIRLMHGFPKKRDRTSLVQLDSGGGFKCFSQLDCPNTDFIWCFNLYHPTESIEICWDSNSTVINRTEHAITLGLETYFTVGEDCTYITGPCIAYHSTPFFFEGGYLTCTSQNDTCLSKSFAKVLVRVSGYETEPPDISYLNSTSELVLGQQNAYHFKFQRTADEYLSGAFFVGLYRNGSFISNPIPEDPFCPTCSGRASRNHVGRLERVRAYVYSISVDGCPSDLVVYHAWLVIDDAQESDALTYALKVTVTVFNPIYRKSEGSRTLDLVPVPPLVDLVPLELPILIQPPSNETTNSSYPPTTVPTVNILLVESGYSVQWTCSVRAGLGDRLIWSLDGLELSPAAANRDGEQEFNCSVQYNNTDNDILPEANNTLPISEYSVSNRTREVSQFVRNYTATLSLCNISSHHSGLYECVVLRPRGENRQVSLWSTQVQLVVPTPEVSTSEAEPTTLATTVTVGLPQNPAVQTYIGLGVFMFLLIVTIVVALFFVAACIQTARRNKVFRSRRPSKRNELVVLTSVDMEKCFLWKEETKRLDSYDDHFEFPRDKLVLMDKVLGEGTFGIVLLAKAEGIVKETPNRNLVAVKTHKEFALDHEKENLWDELELMKHIEPHPNILNLLGYCRETPNTGSPLYLIVEFAAYGNLKNFLKECQDVLFSLNHIPHVFHRNGLHQSCSSCSSSSSYPFLAQRPSFYSGTPTSCTNEHVRLLSQRSRFDSGISTGTPVSDSTLANFDTTFDFSRTASPDTCPDSNVGGEIYEVPSSAYLDFDADSVAPLMHDYVNCKGLLYMEDVTNFALQLARGLKHLEDIKVVHGDLAARNILIAEGFVLKIGDFGMARDIAEKEYYRKHGGQIPVKWTAPEALEDHVFTYQSDVWSYGVILWEIFSYGQRPYSGVKIGQSWDPFINSLKDGNRLQQPNGCPDTFYELMQQCWQISPDKRPSASELVKLCTSYVETDKSSTTSVIGVENLHLQEDCHAPGEDIRSAYDKLSTPVSQTTEEATSLCDRLGEETIDIRDHRPRQDMDSGVNNVKCGDGVSDLEQHSKKRPNLLILKLQETPI